MVPCAHQKRGSKGNEWIGVFRNFNIQREKQIKDLKRTQSLHLQQQQWKVLTIDPESLFEMSRMKGNKVTQTQADAMYQSRYKGTSEKKEIAVRLNDSNFCRALRPSWNSFFVLQFKILLFDMKFISLNCFTQITSGQVSPWGIRPWDYMWCWERVIACWRLNTQWICCRPRQCLTALAN